MIDDHSKHLFQTEVWDYYHAQGRHDLPWRDSVDGNFDPYKITVSEVMLQQTQVNRVIPKYQEFIAQFPTVVSLSRAPLADILKVWSGLGYNRRAKFLWQAARLITKDYHGQLPIETSELIKLPGIGGNTAGAIGAYAYNQPVVFIETNIRTVFIHYFFHNETNIRDSAILELVAATLDTEHPREWYWALMDYGAYLKQSIGNLGRHSASYTKQSRFEGSQRQIRGQVIRLLGDSPHSLAQLQKRIPDQRLQKVLGQLITEQLVRKQGRSYRL